MKYHQMVTTLNLMHLDTACSDSVKCVKRRVTFNDKLDILIIESIYH